MLFRTVIFTIASALFCGTAFAQTAFMPSVTTETLNGQAIELPKQLPSQFTVVMAGYEFDHQAQMDEWLEKLKLKERNQEWLQLHLIGGGYRWLSGFINSRKRPYFPDEYVRSRVVPVYTDVAAFNAAMNWGNTTIIHIAIVDRTGKVLYSDSGAYTDEKGTRFLAAISANHLPALSGNACINFTPTDCKLVGRPSGLHISPVRKPGVATPSLIFMMS
jgi:hypothetical protein